jgi:hypothetical protein
MMVGTCLKTFECIVLTNLGTLTAGIVSERTGDVSCKADCTR